MDREKNLAEFLANNHPDVPHVAYHGSGKDIKKFNTTRGAWFTDKPSLAGEYAGEANGSVYPVHLAIKKPIEFVHAEQRKKIGEIISHATNGAGDLAPEQIDKAKILINELRQTHGDEPKALFEFWRNDPNVSELFRTLGYDGISAFEKADRKTKTWAALNPAQIKSATGNQGTFNPSEPDITKADGGALTDDEGITAYHGSPHDFEQFDMSKIGTGEGAQAYGHGLYFAEAEPVAMEYRDKLTGVDLSPFENIGLAPHHVKAAESYVKTSDPTQLEVAAKDFANWVGVRHTPELTEAFKSAKKQGHMYEVHINAHPDHFLDWDKPFHEQSDHVQQSLMSVPNFEDMGHYKSGMNMGALIDKGLIPHTYDKASPEFSKAYHAAGIKGIRYLDAGSRPDGAYALHISYKGAPYTDPIPMKTFQQAQNHAKEYAAKGYDTEIKENGSRNYVVFDDKLVSVKRKYAQGGDVGTTRYHFADGGTPTDIDPITGKPIVKKPEAGDTSSTGGGGGTGPSVGGAVDGYKDGGKVSYKLKPDDDDRKHA